MPTIFNSKDSVFFVGGRGTKAGTANAGGCTQTFWGSSQNLADVMKDNGQAQGYCDGALITNNGSGKLRISGDENNFATCSVGLVANIVFDAVYSNGRYEVIAVDEGADWIDIDLTYSADTACEIWVGGAFDKAQTAWSNTDATHGYNVTIHSNKSQSKTNGDFVASWLLDTAGGSSTNKSFKRFCGFTTQPGDGGQITFDGEDDTAFDPDGGIGFNNAIENVIFENVIVEDARYNWKFIYANTYTVRLINCEGNSGTHTGMFLRYGRGIVLLGCKASGNLQQGFSLYPDGSAMSHLLVNCISFDNVREGFNSIGGFIAGVLLGCIAYGNGKGGTPYDGFLVSSRYGFGSVINCVAYDNGKHGFEFTENQGIAINCIAKDNGQWGFFGDNAEMAPHVAYCCAHGNSSGQYSLPAGLPAISSIAEDPQFVDAANGDFRPRNPAVLRGGKPDISGNPTQIGAVLQKYQFGDRERVANMARLRIIR